MVEFQPRKFAVNVGDGHGSGFFDVKREAEEVKEKVPAAVVEVVEVVEEVVPPPEVVVVVVSVLVAVVQPTR